jgi:hypothetical protein
MDISRVLYRSGPVGVQEEPSFADMSNYLAREEVLLSLIVLSMMRSICECIYENKIGYFVSYAFSNSGNRDNICETTPNIVLTKTNISCPTAAVFNLPNGNSYET